MQDIEKWDSFCAVQKLSAGDMFEFDEVSVQVLRVYNPEMKDNLVNNRSTVYRIDGPRSSILILGDLGVEGGNELMQNCPPALLQTDYTQMAHHGQWGVSKEFYDYVKPKACIWPSPDWLWDNDVGDGCDTGPYQTVRTREWVSALGVISHFVEKDGIQRIEIKVEKGFTETGEAFLMRLGESLQGVVFKEAWVIESFSNQVGEMLMIDCFVKNMA